MNGDNLSQERHYLLINSEISIIVQRPTQLEKNQNCLVYVTVQDEDEGLSIAQKVVQKRLAACANLYPKIKSVFIYQNQIQTQDEAVLLLKTTLLAYDELERFIIEIHSYDDPCVLKLPIEGGAADFMSWIKEIVVS